MITFKSILPDASQLVAMHPAELGGTVLEYLVSLPPNERSYWHRRNFCQGVATEYAVPRESAPRAVILAFSEAWGWLEAIGLLAVDPEHDGFWYFATKRGREVGSSREAVRAFVASQSLPESFLDVSLLVDVRPLYLQGRFDLAVFGAFHQLEVSIRDAAGLGADLVGTRLAARAFNPDNGPLTDLADELGERQALLNLMTGAVGSYKNPQSHRRVGLDASSARELIIMASHLLKIVASRRPTRP